MIDGVVLNGGELIASVNIDDMDAGSGVVVVNLLLLVPVLRFRLITTTSLRQLLLVMADRHEEQRL